MKTTIERLRYFPIFVFRSLKPGHWQVAFNGAREILRTQGLAGFFRRLASLLDERHQYLFPEYRKWLAKREAGAPCSVEDASIGPSLISILMPTYNTDPRYLAEAIESVRRQTFPHWELCIADDRSTRPDTVDLLRKYANSDPRIRLFLRDRNGHISVASNSALEMARGEFVALLDHDDLLHADALGAVAAELSAHRDAVIVFSDEDKITPDGRRFGPVFKPAWDPDLMLQRNFVSHFGVYRTAAVRMAGGFRQGYEGSQDWDLALRVSEACRPDQIRHIPRVLYHWRAIPGSAALHINEKNYAVEAGFKAVSDCIARRGLPLDCAREPGLAFWSLRACVPSPAPMVSVILGPAEDDRVLGAAAETLARTTDYRQLEILPLRREPGVEEGEALNQAARRSKGEVLCVLDPRLEALRPDWLRELVAHSLRDDVGAVGTRIVSPSGDIVHGGYVLDSAAIYREPYRGAHPSHRGYMDQVLLLRTVAAVGGGCLAVSRDKYQQAGGYGPDFQRPIADIDLCLRLSALDLRNVWLPAPLLQGSLPERTDRDKDLARMRQIWGPELLHDRALNPNLTINRFYPDLRHAEPAIAQLP